MSLSRCKALTEKENFIKLLKKKPGRLGCFEIYRTDSLSVNPDRELGFIISKKQVKLAVLRNKIKRSAHEVLRLTQTPFTCLIRVSRLITKKNIKDQLNLLKQLLS